MDNVTTKLIVQNYNFATTDDIESVLSFIANKKKVELGIDFHFNITLDEGGRVLDERSNDGKLQLDIGLSQLYDIHEQKYLTGECDVLEERKIFIEAILSTFHETRHIEQINNIIDNPVYTDENYKMTKERIINEVFPMYTNLFNYESSYCEIDAMKSSLVETSLFFQQMGSDITPNEVFQVMQEKELYYLNYNLNEFGNSYESAIDHFDNLRDSSHKINGFPEIISYMSEEDRTIFYSQCSQLFDFFLQEEDYDKKMDILVNISLIIKPELLDKYPLINNGNYKKR